MLGPLSHPQGAAGDDVETAAVPGGVKCVQGTLAGDGAGVIGPALHALLGMIKVGAKLFAAFGRRTAVLTHWLW